MRTDKLACRCSSFDAKEAKGVCITTMKSLVEVVGIHESNCINCHQCIAVCPVKICSDGSGDVVKFNNDHCIGCGRCIEACIKAHGNDVSKSARYPIDDSPAFLKALEDSSTEIVALLAPSARSNFDLPRLISAIRLLGIKATYDVSLGAEITIAGYGDLIEENQAPLPIIAQPCPVVVSHIELNHPRLIKHLAPVGSPVYNLAIQVKKRHPQARLLFISPCLAKRREFARHGAVDYNVIFANFIDILARQGICLEDMEPGSFDTLAPACSAVGFSMPGGLKYAFMNHYPRTLSSDIIRIEGPEVFDSYLQGLEKSLEDGWTGDMPKIIDVLSCTNGCNYGPGCPQQSRPIFQAESAVAREAEHRGHDQASRRKLGRFLAKVRASGDYRYDQYHDLSMHQNIKQPSETDLAAIFVQMQKESPSDYRNCAACGYHSCHDMAVAVFNGLNKVENCYLYREKELLREQQILSGMVQNLEFLNKELHIQITERKNQEQMLVHHSKLAAMGEMIGMIAHQWRQPLSSISTLAGNLKIYMELDLFNRAEFDALLDEINHHSQYLSNTINDFRNFFRPDNPMDTIRLDQVIENTLGIVGKSLEYNHIQVHKDYAFEKEILTYPNELMQVFLNILKNASDAFAGSRASNPCITIRGREGSKYHEVEIIDNAGGIPEKIMPNIFEPYFSTKGSGLGTGLGLYMCKMIVEEHCKGELLAKNRDSGAAFIVRLPAG